MLAKKREEHSGKDELSQSATMLLVWTKECLTPSYAPSQPRRSATCSHRRLAARQFRRQLLRSGPRVLSAFGRQHPLVTLVTPLVTLVTP